MPKSTKKTAPGQPARQAAAALLAGVLADRRMLTDRASADILAGLAPNERARAQALAAGVLRNLDPIDTVLAQFLDRPPNLAGLNILRIAAFELLVDGVPPHAAVDAAVRQARSHKRTAGLAGMTNAVARKLASEGPSLWPDLDPTPLPGWIAGPLRRATEADAVAAVERVLAQSPPLDLTPRDPAAAQGIAEELGATLLPSGSLRLARGGQVTTLPGYDQGSWWVQDAAAAMPVRMLGDVAGRTVLDLCAAPGGKTMQLAAAGADVTAVDIARDRMARLRDNLKRTGLKAALVTADLTEWAPQEPADVIVLDAPCSASGTLRRHPDIPHVRPDPDLRPLLALQAQLIDRALGWLKPGGRLLYITCSMLPAEGEAQIAAARQRHSGLQVLPPAQPALLPQGALTDAGFLRTRPDMWADIGGMDGFFAAIVTCDA